MLTENVEEEKSGMNGATKVRPKEIVIEPAKLLAITFVPYFFRRKCSHIHTTMPWQCCLSIVEDAKNIPINFITKVLFMLVTHRIRFPLYLFGIE